MQYECEEVLVEFRTSSHPSWSRWQGADTVSHVVLWWHGSCFRELRYPQKARQHRHLHQDFDVNAPLCIYRYGDAARTHARSTYRHAHASTHTYIQIVKNLSEIPEFCWFSLIHQRRPFKHLHFKVVDVLKRTHIHIHIYANIQTTSSKFANYIYMDGSCIDAYWWSVA